LVILSLSHSIRPRVLGGNSEMVLSTHSKQVKGPTLVTVAEGRSASGRFRRRVAVLMEAGVVAVAQWTAGRGEFLVSVKSHSGISTRPFLQPVG
jgi:hypothetical protein